MTKITIGTLETKAYGYGVDVLRIRTTKDMLARWKAIREEMKDAYGRPVSVTVAFHMVMKAYEEATVKPAMSL